MYFFRINSSEEIIYAEIEARTALGKLKCGEASLTEDFIVVFRSEPCAPTQVICVRLISSNERYGLARGGGGIAGWLSPSHSDALVPLQVYPFFFFFFFFFFFCLN